MNFKQFGKTANLFPDNAVRYENALGPGAKIVSYTGGAMYIIPIANGATYTCKIYTPNVSILVVRLALYDKSSPSVGDVVYGLQEVLNQVEPTLTITNSYNKPYLIVQISGAYVDAYGIDDVMLNLGSTALPYQPYKDWTNTPHYIMGTSTDTITTLPAVLYPNDITATVGLKGQMEQSGTPTPTTPIQPSECGDLETTGEHAGQYKIPILNNSQTTNVYLGEVQTTRKTGQKILKGDESITYNAVGGHSQFNISGLYATSNYQIGYCSHYNYQYANQNYNIYHSSNNSDTNIYIFDDNYTSADDFKAYLAQQYAAGTPVTIWYVLAEPTTGIVNEPIRKIGTYADEVSGITISTTAGANTLSIGTTLQPSEVNVTYHGWHPVADVHERESGAWT